MLGPDQCGPNLLIWRPADDPRNLFNCAPKDILAIAGSGRAAGRVAEDENAEGDGGESTSSHAAPSAAASQRFIPVPVCLLAMYARQACRRILFDDDAFGVGHAVGAGRTCVAWT